MVDLSKILLYENVPDDVTGENLKELFSKDNVIGKFDVWNGKVPNSHRVCYWYGPRTEPWGISQFTILFVLAKSYVTGSEYGPVVKVVMDTLEQVAVIVFKFSESVHRSIRALENTELNGKRMELYPGTVIDEVYQEKH